MPEQPIHLTSTGPPETIINPHDSDALAALAEATNAPTADQKPLVAEIITQWPSFLDGWAAMGQLAQEPVEAYAYFRVGYHRGLDALRAAGWRGSGYVRWSEETNLGFLRSLLGLHRAAAAIGEIDEEERTGQFLMQLDPSGVPGGE
ncbi:MAG TPA: DUF3151 family protein [Acidimicrobiales bacterium]|jgi:hypothetical protein|nr:DUF3151 family protein [Acidimicrobiales bacterium]|tara:strand:+ start:545 stop:985 length:441 start_codon:yes stop_codon:yes gene_type:complete